MGEAPSKGAGNFLHDIPLTRTCMPPPVRQTPPRLTSHAHTPRSDRRPVCNFASPSHVKRHVIITSGAAGAALLAGGASEAAKEEQCSKNENERKSRVVSSGRCRLYELSVCGHKYL